MDDLSYPMIKNLPLREKQILLNNYNTFLMGDNLPNTWKKMNNINLFKHNKDPSSADSYRLIFWSSCGCKTRNNDQKSNRLDVGAHPHL